MLSLLAAVAISAQRPDQNDILIVPAPKSFAGITLGKADYLTAEKLWGKAKHSVGAHPGGNRDVDLPGGIHIGYQGWTPSPFGPTWKNFYLLDGVAIETWKGNLPQSLLKVKGPLRILGDLRRGESLSSTKAKLTKAGVKFKMINSEEYNAPGPRLILAFGDGLDSIFYAR